MRKLLLICVIALVSNEIDAQKRLVLEGHYQGKNIFVQNPFNGDGGVGFCTEKVTVNDKVTSDEISSSAYEIDFTKHGLKMGDPVTVVIEHGSECTPKVLNKEVLKPTSTCKYTSVEIDGEGNVKWTTTGETGKLPFIVEMYNWNKWIPIGEVDGEGTPEQHEYGFKVNMHSGSVKVRVKQIDHTKRANSSQPKSISSTVPEVTFEPKKVNKEIKFSAKTRYEIFDAYGNPVKKGAGESVDCSGLTKGIYYLNYDNKSEKFLKK